MDQLTFSALLLLTRPTFVEALGVDRVTRMRGDAKKVLSGLLPQIPKDAPSGARSFYLATAYLAAIHRALPERSAAENAGLVTAALRRVARWLPRPVIRLRRWLWFQPWYNRRLASSIVGGADGFVGDYAAAPDGFGVNYHRCGLQIFLARVGVPEIGPLVCAFDQLESEIFGLGLVRTGTIAQGAKVCDFRWTRPEDRAPT